VLVIRLYHLNSYVGTQIFSPFEALRHLEYILPACIFRIKVQVLIDKWIGQLLLEKFIESIQVLRYISQKISTHLCYYLLQVDDITRVMQDTLLKINVHLEKFANS